MRRIALAAALIATTQLAGCFIFIPGSLIRAVSDSITGAEGAHCVSSSVKVGDRINMPYGGVGEVKSLSGTSISCTSADKPIRARIE